MYLCQLNIIIRIGSPELGKQSKNKCEAEENTGTVIFVYRSLDAHIYRSMWCDWKVSGLNLFLCNRNDIYVLNCCPLQSSLFGTLYKEFNSHAPFEAFCAVLCLKLGK